MKDPILSVTVNPSDIVRANSLGFRKVPHPKMPVGLYFVLLKGGKYGS